MKLETMLFGLLQCGMGHSFQRNQNVNAMMPDNVRERVKRWAEEGNCRALMIGVSVRTLQNWEQGRRNPEGPAKALLRVASRNPNAVLDALHAE
jgi:hypothetical protein